VDEGVHHPGPVNPCALKVLIAPMRAGMSTTSSARRNNHHDSGVAPPCLFFAKEGSTEAKLGR
jgi:hypothetical protein